MKTKSCPIHKKYKGKTKPKISCPECWRMYLELQKFKKRVPIKPTKVIPDKTKYNRKKIKKVEDD